MIDSVRRACCFLNSKKELSEDIPPMMDPKSLPIYIPNVTNGRVIKVYDGDTITIAANLNKTTYKFSVRLNGIDTPEMHTKNNEEKEVAVMARDALKSKIFGQHINLKNVSIEKYGRLLADVYFEDCHLNNWMLENYYAVPYDGGTKQIPTSWSKYLNTGSLV